MKQFSVFKEWMCLQRDYYYKFVHLIPLAMLEKYEDNEPVLEKFTNSFYFSLVLMVLRADIQDTQKEQRLCRLTMMLALFEKDYVTSLTLLIPLNITSVTNAKIFLFCDVVWIIFIYDVVVSDMRARYQRITWWCGVTWFPGILFA